MTVMTESGFIHAGWIIDGTGGPVQQDMAVQIDKGFIRSVAVSQGYLVNKPGAVDLSDCTILPGLVDAHVHLFMSGVNDPALRALQLNADYNFIKPVIAKHLKQLHTYGVRAVRDGGDYGGYALRYKNECPDDTLCPVQIKTAGKAWRKPGRYGKLIGRPPADGQTLAGAIKSQNISADHVKIVQSGLNSLSQFGRETPPQFTLEELSEAVSAAHKRGLKVMVHCNGEQPVKTAVQAGCDSVEHGFFMGTDNLKRMADTGTVWVPTAVTMKAYAEHLNPDSTEAVMARRNLDHQLEQIAEAKRLGVVIALGTDAGSLGVHHGSAVFEELKLLISAGFTLPEAIQCATGNGAGLLGIKRQGQITKGMAATFIIFKGSPEKLLQSSGKSGFLTESQAIKKNRVSETRKSHGIYNG
ncbi:amidohydrolase family protein [Desulfococcaceae bacterium HSG9]|nr:amidohydrolase family protein [Desulfococcaceae bacterium HSG9]